MELFVERFLARAAELQNVEPKGLLDPGKDDVIIGELPPKLIGIAAAWYELKDAMRSVCAVFKAKKAELADKEDAESVAAFKAANNEHEMRHLEEKTAKDLFWASVRLHFSQICDADRIGLARKDDKTFLVEVHRENEPGDPSETLAALLGGRVGRVTLVRL